MENREAAEIMYKVGKCIDGECPFGADSDACSSGCMYYATAEQEREARKNAISALKKLDQYKWHSVVKEGNPKKNGFYLLTTKNGWVTEDFYHKDYEEWGKACQRTVYEVVAWREKPEPYTEEVHD